MGVSHISHGCRAHVALICSQPIRAFFMNGLAINDPPSVALPAAHLCLSHSLVALAWKARFYLRPAFRKNHASRTSLNG